MRERKLEYDAHLNDRGVVEREDGDGDGKKERTGRW
jgi:hypothetical protein